MKVNLQHPTFLLFLETVSTNILTNVKTDNYFSLTNEKKRGIQYLTLKVISQVIKNRIKITDEELLDFIKILLSRNEESEQFELAGILNDITNDFKSLNDKIVEIKKTKRIIKIDKPANE